MTRQHRGLSGILSSAGTGVASLTAGILLLPLVIATVGASPYGVWLTISAAALLLNYSDLGIGAAIVHFGARFRGSRSTSDPSALLSAGLMWNTVACAVAAPLFSWFAFAFASATSAEISETDAFLVVAAGVAIVLGLLVRPHASTLVGAGLLPLERATQAVGVGIRVVGTVSVCLVSPSVGALAVVEATAALAPAIISAAIVRMRGIARIRWARSSIATMRMMMSYSIRAFSVSLLGAGLLQGGTLAAGLLLSPADVTYFNAAFRIYSSVRQGITWLVEPYRAALSRLGAFDRRGTADVVYALCGVIFIAVTAGALALACLAPAFVPLWLGSGVPVATIASTTAVLLVGLIANAVHIPLAPAADAMGRPGVFAGPQALWLALFCVLVAPLVNLWGTVGVAVALTVPLVLVEPAYLLIAHRALGLSIGRWLTEVGKPWLIAMVGPAVLATACYWATSGLEGLLRSVLATTTFAIAASMTLFIWPRPFPRAQLTRILRTEL